MVASPAAVRADGPSVEPFEKDGENDKKEGDIFVISSQGDVVLRVHHGSTMPAQQHKFRVRSDMLKAKSKYFNNLLDGRYAETKQIEAMHRGLRGAYGSPEKAPADKLPVLRIEDVGQISAVRSVAPLFMDFLRILHGLNIQSPTPVSNLANLTIVADRFDSLDSLKDYMHRRKILRAIDGKTTSKSDSALTEERVRQRLFVGIKLEHTLWIEKYSLRLIMKGWIGKEAHEDDALWWDLPGRVEDELTYRRKWVLDTIQSLQSYFVGLYVSRDRQCKLGYDSSAQCDSFQLGEMIRFFARIGTIQLNGTIGDRAKSSSSFSGDINVLIDTLRQVPEYQIDRNHMHCGVRTRLIPLLDLIVDCLPHVGICGECWLEQRDEYAWMNARRPLLWKRQSFQPRGLGRSEMHDNVRAMFTASQRDWSTLGSSTTSSEKSYN